MHTSHSNTQYKNESSTVKWAKVTRTPIFGPCILWLKRLYGSKCQPRPRRQCQIGTKLPPKKGHAPPIFGPCLLWPNGCMHQDTTWYGGRPQSGRHCVRWGPSFPPEKGVGAPNFRILSIVTKTPVCIRIPLGTEVGLSLGDIVLDGDLASLPLKEHSSQFLANVRCGQTAGWTKMPLGMEVGLGHAPSCTMGTQLPPSQKKGA